MNDFAGASRSWWEVGSKSACDTEAGEVNMPSSWSAPSLERCKKSCEDTAGCQSITFYRNKVKWCRHFSTPCIKTKRNNKAVSHLLSAKSRSNRDSVSIANQYSPKHGMEVYQLPTSLASPKTCTLAYVFLCVLYAREFFSSI